MDGNPLFPLRVPETPAFVYDEAAILQHLRALQPLRARGLKLLYSMKAFPLLALMQKMQPWLDGFSASAAFEAQLAHDASPPGALLHITSPGLHLGDMDIISQTCSHISFNSISQYQRLSPRCSEHQQLGLRINPGLSFLDDPRFDPCRRHSKLGVAVEKLPELIGDNVSISGIQFHTIFDCSDMLPLQQTLARLEVFFDHQPRPLDWINLGGGYHVRSESARAAMLAILFNLQQIGFKNILFEPGKGLVGHAGYLVASVVDCFDSAGKSIAVLDTSINHHPEVFEYQRSPLLDEPNDGPYPVTLAGGTCLAGDLFGEYHLHRRLKPGDRVVMRDVGAYTLIKANRFNGHKLPDIYAWDGDALHCVRRDEYADYFTQWGVPAAARH